MDEHERAGSEGDAPDGDAEARRDAAQDAAERRQHDRAEHVAEALAGVRSDLEGREYPVSSEELAATYADQPIDLPNETESIGSVFQRIEDSFEDERAAFDALITEMNADDRLGDRGDVRAAEPATWSEERAETQHEFEEAREKPIDEEDYESSVVRSRERDREAEAKSDDE
jgi:hypothetical protein